MRFRDLPSHDETTTPTEAYTAELRLSTPLENALDPLAGIEIPSAWHLCPSTSRASWPRRIASSARKG
jgi:hypothetical protein